ncbi:MAG TPA: carboxypeptidase M32 [Planctomycetaceae bacterium]|nr:carboxypeptidase M32 [Planctomycetaceae bacterium]
MARTEALAHEPWVQARQRDDFSLFAPWLEKLIKLKREWIDAVGYEQDPYDALLEEYEPGTRAAELEELFNGLCPPLTRLIDRVLGSPRHRPEQQFEGFFAADRQRELSVQVATELGFDFTRGRLDTSVHPFCAGLAECDVRVTTRYKSCNPIEGLLSVVHEVGHGMYAQGLRPEHRGTPMAWPASYAVHESQSRWWENFLGRSRPFWARYLPRMQAMFFDQLRDFELDSFLLAVNRVRRSLIRTEADEVSYNLHIAVRLEIERALLAGGLAVADVPDAWNERMARYVGVRPTRHCDGSLQDIHWSMGAFGYFPSYTLGNIYAAQLHWRLTRDIPDWERRVEAGQFAELLEWMRSHIHHYGSFYPPRELIERATGQQPDSRFLIEYLESKYGELYGLS